MVTRSQISSLKVRIFLILAIPIKWVIMSEPNSYYDAKGIVEMDLILKKEFSALFDNGT